MVPSAALTRISRISAKVVGSVDVISTATSPWRAVRQWEASGSVMLAAPTSFAEPNRANPGENRSVQILTWRIIRASGNIICRVGVAVIWPLRGGRPPIGVAVGVVRVGTLVAADRVGVTGIRGGRVAVAARLVAVAAGLVGVAVAALRVGVAVVAGLVAVAARRVGVAAPICCPTGVLVARPGRGVAVETLVGRGGRRVAVG